MFGWVTLWVVRTIVNDALLAMSADFDAQCAPLGRGSIPPERLLRALILRALYSIRSEREVVEWIEFDLLLRWFLGLGIDDSVWNATTFTKNRDRLLAGDIAAKLLATVLAHPRSNGRCQTSISRLTARCWNPGRACREFVELNLGLCCTVRIGLDTREEVAMWLTSNNKSYDVAFTKELHGVPGRFHHVTFAPDSSEEALRAADIFYNAGVPIDTGPHKHAVQQTFFTTCSSPVGTGSKSPMPVRA